MTEVQKYQGIFIQKQRELKQVLKQQEKDKKNGGNEETKGEDEDQPEGEKTKALRKFLKSGKGFKGWADTAEEMLEEVKNIDIQFDNRRGNQ